MTRLLLAVFLAALCFSASVQATEAFNALVEAIRSRNVDMVTNMLLADSTNALIQEKDLTGRTLLHIAAGQGDVRIVQAILARNPDVNAVTRTGQSALLFAASGSYLDNTRLLLAARADPNLADDRGNTPLLIASDRGKPEMVSALLSAGADIDHANRDGVTSLMYAAERGNKKLAQLLLDSRATVIATDALGNTALHYAARTGRNDMVPLMIQLINVKNAAGQTPLDVAMLAGQSKFSGVIQTYGGTMGVGRKR